jgi:amino acid transporter
MGLKELLIGRPLKHEDEQVEQIGPGSGIPVLGLDALGSAAYGPEAALTVLLPLGLLATAYIAPITICIAGLLLAVFLSYLQTIRAYPGGGGSYTVAKENLGPFSALLAAGALCLDYVLNVAVGIAAGVGALVSAVPVLLPYTLWFCLGLLALLTVVNLRGIRSTGLLFMAPTYLFVAMLFISFGIGIAKTISAHGSPMPLSPTHAARPPAEMATLWLLVRAFASGCTALTGVEAVSNAVPVFRKPTVRNARITLTSIVLTLMLLLGGVASLCRAYGITATIPGQPGYQSILSQLVASVMGRGGFYYVTMFSIISVLCLSANTSFAGFPRVCRVLAQDEYLPAEFAHRGSRLVYTGGIIVLSILSGALLIAFRGVTDRLIPLFAIGAFGAFTISQIGMVVHWWKRKDSRKTASLLLNGVGACATSGTLLVIIAAKFTEGAWLVLLVLPPIIFLFLRVRKYQAFVEDEIDSAGPVDFDDLPAPIVVIPLKRLDGVGRKALRLAVRLSPDVQAVQVLSETLKTEDLEAVWKETVVGPAQRRGYSAPKLIVIKSVYREFFGPFLEYLGRLAKENPEKQIGVMVPELVEKRWYHFLFRHRATWLKGLLLMKGGPQIFIINTPWYIEKQAALPQPSAEPVPIRVASA